MQLADVVLECEHCKENALKSKVLFQEKSIDQVLDMTVDDAIAFFTQHKEIS